MNNILAAKLTAQSIKAHNTHSGGYSVTVSKHRLAQKCYDHAISNTQIKPVSNWFQNSFKSVEGSCVNPPNALWKLLSANHMMDVVWLNLLKRKRCL